MCWQCKTCTWREMTLDPQGFSHMSQCCSPFTLNLEPKPSCSLGATLGLGCFSAALYLFRQALTQPLIFGRPQHVTDRIMSVSPAGVHVGVLCCNPDCALRQINVAMSKQWDNLSLIFLLQGWEKQRCNAQRDKCERETELEWEADPEECWDMRVDESDSGNGVWFEIRRKIFIMCRLCFSSHWSFFAKYLEALFHHYGVERTGDREKMRELKFEKRKVIGQRYWVS